MNISDLNVHSLTQRMYPILYAHYLTPWKYSTSMFTLAPCEYFRLVCSLLPNKLSDPCSLSYPMTMSDLHAHSLTQWKYPTYMLFTLIHNIRLTCYLLSCTIADFSDTLIHNIRLSVYSHTQYPTFQFTLLHNIQLFCLFSYTIRLFCLFSCTISDFSDTLIHNIRLFCLLSYTVRLFCLLFYTIPYFPGYSHTQIPYFLIL